MEENLLTPLLEAAGALVALGGLFGVLVFSVSLRK